MPCAIHRSKPRFCKPSIGCMGSGVDDFVEGQAVPFEEISRNRAHMLLTKTSVSAELSVLSRRPSFRTS
jgi:hypothetical protein